MTAAIAAAAAFAFTSCTYDPYYSSVGASYDSGYGSNYGPGYGYGGSGFSTSLFVSTGDPRWGYDPYCYSYYDYRSRRYYDPYLHGYYPIGYRPPIVIGVPHPYGWRPGHGYCPPPRTVRNVTVVNYRDRESAYRRSNYSWRENVRIRPDSRDRTRYQDRNRSSRYSDSRQREERFTTPSRSRTFEPQRQTPNIRQNRSRESYSSYDTPVTRATSRQGNYRQSDHAVRSRSIPPSQPSSQGRMGRGERPTPPAYQQRGGDRRTREESTPDSNQRRGYRSLGQG